MAETLDMIDEWIASDARHFVCTVDVHALMESETNDDIRRIYRSDAAVVTADGMPIVWFLRRRGRPTAERICGPDLMPALFRRSETRRYRNFLYGASSETLARLRDRLTREFPRAHIVGTFSPPFRALSEAEEANVVDMLNATEPDIVWVGLGAPKQDRWMAAHRATLHAPVLIGVGAAFDMLAGTVRRAPVVMQRTGCEWMFRIAQEPRRLLKRYVKSNSQFAIRLLIEMLHSTTPPSHAA
jgi:N-acetylglucosaminyldiphosphoundecaprenol N-acetyl-beta-D-mannosaminyltransferase